MYARDNLSENMQILFIPATKNKIKMQTLFFKVKPMRIDFRTRNQPDRVKKNEKKKA